MVGPGSGGLAPDCVAKPDQYFNLRVNETLSHRMNGFPTFSLCIRRLSSNWRTINDQLARIRV